MVILPFLAPAKKGRITIAEAAAITANRTPAEQIEHWALLGQQANKTIKLDEMLDVRCGIAQLKVEKIIPPTTNPYTVFQTLETDGQ